MTRPWKIYRRTLLFNCNYSCQMCGINQGLLKTKKGRPDLLTIDHIIPVSQGGGHNIGNLQMLCKKCHSAKDNPNGYANSVVDRLNEEIL